MNSQTTPVVFQIGEKLTNYTAFETALQGAQSLIPDGGTCPGAAFERALGQVMANDLITRPFKAALVYTDGVFFDQPAPQIAAKGFVHRKLL